MNTKKLLCCPECGKKPNIFIEISERNKNSSFCKVECCDEKDDLHLTVSYSNCGEPVKKTIRKTFKDWNYRVNWYNKRKNERTLKNERG